MIGGLLGELREALAATNERLLPTFQFDVIHAVRELRGEAYGAEIRRYLCKLQNRDVAIGQVFTCLATLEDGGLIGAVDDSEDDRNARRRRVYSVTPAGVAALERSAAAAQAFCATPIDRRAGSVA